MSMNCSEITIYLEVFTFLTVRNGMERPVYIFVVIHVRAYREVSLDAEGY